MRIVYCSLLSLLFIRHTTSIVAYERYGTSFSTLSIDRCYVIMMADRKGTEAAGLPCRLGDNENDSSSRIGEDCYRRTRRPTVKILENSFSQLSTSLPSLWRNVRKTVESLSSVPDSLPEIRSAITHANSSLVRYRAAWHDMKELFVLGREMFKDKAEELRS